MWTLGRKQHYLSLIFFHCMDEITTWHLLFWTWDLKSLERTHLYANVYWTPFIEQETDLQWGQGLKLISMRLPLYRCKNSNIFHGLAYHFSHQRFILKPISWYHLDDCELSGRASFVQRTRPTLTLVKYICVHLTLTKITTRIWLIDNKSSADRKYQQYSKPLFLRIRLQASSFIDYNHLCHGLPSFTYHRSIKRASIDSA